MHFKSLIFCFIFLFILNNILWAESKFKVTFLLSWNLKPYWNFINGFQEESEFEEEILLLENNFWVDNQLKSAKYIIPLGHKAYNKVLSISPSCPIFVALIVAPEMIKKTDKIDLRGGIYLRLPPDIFLPIIRQKLQEFFPSLITIGIPFTSYENKYFVKEVSKKAHKWNFKVIPINLKSNKTLKNFWSKIDVLYLIPDPFLDSEEVIAQIIKKAILQQKIVIGYNKFFLKKGAFLAFIINYKEAGRKCAQILRVCLPKNTFCGWHPAPFKIKINEKLLNFYRTIFLHKNAEK